MFAIYCNHCFQDNKINSRLEFYFSTCKHVFCKDCVSSVCTICKRQYKPTLICKKMPPELNVFFEDYPKIFRNFQKVTRFQLTQLSHFANYHVNTLPALKKKMLQEHNGLIKLGGRIGDALKAENERIEKLKDYLAYYERRLEQMPIMALPSSQQPPILGRRRLSSVKTGKIFSMGSSSQARVQTPTLSLPDSNTSSTTVSGPRLLNSKQSQNNFQF